MISGGSVEEECKIGCDVVGVGKEGGEVLLEEGMR